MKITKEKTDSYDGEESAAGTFKEQRKDDKGAREGLKDCPVPVYVLGMNALVCKGIHHTYKPTG